MVRRCFILQIRGAILDFRTSTYFMTVAEELNFTKAAKRLGMSQPPLSNTIKELERDLGVKLFIRGRSHLILTEAGILLKKRTSQILDLARKTRDEIESINLKNEGTIFIAAENVIPPEIISSKISKFKKEYKGASFDIVRLGREEVIQRLKDGVCDIAYISTKFDSEHFDGKTVLKLPWMAVAKKGSKIFKTGDKYVTSTFFKGRDIALPKSAFGNDKLSRTVKPDDVNIVCNLSGREEAVSLAKEGMAVCVYPMDPTKLPAGVEGRPIGKQMIYEEYTMVYGKNIQDDGLIRDFIRD